MQAIEALRQSVKTATDLSVPWELFHDRLASSAEFMAMGAPTKSPMVLEMLAATASKALGASLTAVGMTSLHLKRERLCTGSVRWVADRRCTSTSRISRLGSRG